MPHAAVAALAPQPGEAELMIAFRSEQLASLAAAGALSVDLRQQLTTGLTDYYRSPVHLLLPGEYAMTLRFLAEEAAVPLSTVQAWADPLTQKITVGLDQKSELNDIQQEISSLQQWRILTPEALLGLADALALSSGGGAALWEMTLNERCVVSGDRCPYSMPGLPTKLAESIATNR